MSERNPDSPPAWYEDVWKRRYATFATGKDTGPPVAFPVSREHRYVMVWEPCECGHAETDHTFAGMAGRPCKHRDTNCLCPGYRPL